ncbi:MAG TPA: type II CAAX endopeptidase family protein [Candidatus Saccharibacteria bacterium]|nr:type II CAAX endopeptidase family protein [Candidatus Saccharibacteria bacterium]HRK94340.1 type II CAAX endopeptidase family protein [Candidatus Saccharibacteria bacterium]
MSANSSARPARAALLTVWVLVAFIGAQIIGSLLLIGLFFVIPGLESFNSAIIATASAVISYSLTLTLLIGVPYLLQHRKTSLKTLGIDRPMSWPDIGFGTLGFLPYAILTAVTIWLFTSVFQVIDPEQSQALPFDNLVMQYEYIVAFVTLVILAPIAEELLFRGYFLGKMSGYVNKWAAIIVTAVIFALMHVPGFTSDGGFQLQWGAAADTLALGLVLGGLRVFTGSIWAGVLLHMLKNAIAYYVLFIAPSVPGTM